MVEFSAENFEKEIAQAPKPVLVDFWLPGCSPCFLFLPILEKLEKEFKEKILFVKANLEAVPLIARKYGLNVVPTIVLFEKGEPVSGFVGLKPEEAVRNWLKERLLIQEYRAYAESQGFSLNPNQEIVEGLVRSLLEKERKLGKRFCPCRQLTLDQKEDQKIICPCFYHSQEIKEQGHCLCGLFVKKIIK